MSIDDYIYTINYHRKKYNPDSVGIVLNQRPGSSNPRITTIELLIGSEVLFKSQHWGSMNIFLRGMLQAFTNKNMGGVKIESSTKLTQPLRQHRLLEI